MKLSELNNYIKETQRNNNFFDEDDYKKIYVITEDLSNVFVAILSSNTVNFSSVDGYKKTIFFGESPEIYVFEIMEDLTKHVCAIARSKIVSHNNDGEKLLGLLDFIEGNL
jgi:hypothetical protein